MTKVSPVIPTAAAARSRALPTIGSPFGRRGIASAWRVTRGLGDSSYMRTDVSAATYNSNLTVDAVVPVPAGRNGFGSAKQAAPPRGVPR